MTIPPDVLARFREACPLINGDDERVGVAVSGGPDSLALLLLAHAAWPGRVIAATVDHRLRPEAAAEAVFVADICAGLGVPHATLVPDVPITGSLQTAARAARYALLERWRADNGASCVMTAHHADDQAETLLMRLNRGAGIAGLSAIRAANGNVLRPLLGWRRAELASIVNAAGIMPVEDPSNSDQRFDRVRMRARLAENDWLDVPALARSAAYLAEAGEAIGWMVEQLAADRLTGESGEVLFDPRSLPDTLVRRLTLIALARIDPDCAPSGPALDRLLETLRMGGQASMGAALCRGGTIWRFILAPPRNGKE